MSRRRRRRLTRLGRVVFALWAGVVLALNVVIAGQWGDVVTATPLRRGVIVLVVVATVLVTALDGLLEDRDD